MSVFAEVEGGAGAIDRLGLARFGNRWQARINGESAKALEELLRKAAVVCFEPGTHELVAGPGEGRRAFLDWMLFHVEPDFLLGWRRYHRALKQRNSLLKSGTDLSSLAGWDTELIKAGLVLDEQRQRWILLWQPLLLRVLNQFLPELGGSQLTYQQGWPAEQSLEEALDRTRARDLARGFTSKGPHRADWSIGFELAPQREHLSRGQAKLAALAAVLTQGEILQTHLGSWPIVCLDDLGSELDQEHQQAVLSFLKQTGAQVLISGTSEPPGLRDISADVHRFHVEQGRVTPLL